MTISAMWRGISNSQIKNLRAVGVERLADLAELEEVPELPQGSSEALTRIRDQARVQAVGREKKIPYHELKEPFDAEHGLVLLPAPTPDDISLIPRAIILRNKVFRNT